jgi:type II secretory pathway pseudopilin PulG
VLIGVVLPVAMRGVTAALQSASRARHVAEATQLAQQKLAEFLVDRQTANLNSSGDFGPEWPEYRWSSRGLSFASTSCYEVQLRVAWPERGGEGAITVSTLLYPSTSGDAAASSSSGTSGAGGTP